MISEAQNLLQKVSGILIILLLLYKYVVVCTIY